MHSKRCSRKSHQSLAALCPRQDQARVGHVVAQVNMCTPAQDPSSFLQWNISFYGNSIRTNYGAVSSSLTLDFATFRISARRNKNAENSSAVIESRCFTKCVHRTCSYFSYVILGIQLERIAREEACLLVSKAVTPDIFHHAGHLQDTNNNSISRLLIILLAQVFFVCFVLF